LLAFAGRHLTLWNYFLGEEGTASYIVEGNRLDGSQKKKSLGREIIVLLLEPLYHLRTGFSVRPEFTVLILLNN